MDAQAKIIRLPKVKELVGLGKTAIYDKIKEGDFPKPIKLGRASGWLEGDVQEWIGQQVQAQRGGGAA
jgi:prophage regulatory protein